jgi:antitoxin component YwqK of YwqJK toxin-antitoxin module
MYFNCLKEELQKDSSIRKIRFIEKKYSNGNILRQSLYVKYKNDPTRRYWLIGKSFMYFENGQLGCIEEVGIKEKQFVDTTKFFSTNGNIVCLRIFNNYLLDAVPVKEVIGFWSIFRKYHQSYPKLYKEITFDKTQKIEKDYKYFSEKGWLIDGDVKYYNQDGTIEKVVKYSMGKTAD